MISPIYLRMVVAITVITTTILFFHPYNYNFFSVEEKLNRIDQRIVLLKSDTESLNQIIGALKKELADVNVQPVNEIEVDHRDIGVQPFNEIELDHREKGKKDKKKITRLSKKKIKFVNGKPPLVIWIPFDMGSVEKLTQTLEMWKHFEPCTGKRPIADLVFYSAHKPSLETFQDFEDSCINDITFHQVLIPDELNTYSKAPGYQFMDTFIGLDRQGPFQHQSFIKPYHKYMLQMESDVVPTKKMWLVDVLKEAIYQDEEEGGFWLLGSKDQCRNDHLSQDTINANGLWKLHDRGFMKFLDQVRNTYCFGFKDTPGCPNTGYDNAIGFAMDQEKDSDLANKYFRLIRQTTVIRNCPYDDFSNEMGNPAIVHNKVFDYDNFFNRRSHEK